MATMRAGFQIAVIIVGLIWLGSCLFLGPITDLIPEGESRSLVASLPSPLIMISTTDDMAGAKGLRQEVRAKRIGPEGGVLRCGPAVLVVPPQAALAGTRFCLEDFSTHMPSVELIQTGSAISQAAELRISYLGTPYESSGFDLSALKIYRQISPNRYEPMPSRVDLSAGCVIAEVKDSGRYVIA